MGLQHEEEEAERAAGFSRRTLIFGAGAAALFAGLFARQYQLQIVDGAQYRTMADDNRISVQLLPPPRGRILDRFGVELAGNRMNYRIMLVPEQTKSVKASLNELARYVPISDRQREKVMREARGRSGLAVVAVVEDLSWNDFAALNLRMAELEGFQPDAGQIRTYPYGASLSHVLGYVDAVSERDLQNTTDTDPLLRLPDFPIGKNGVERAVDRVLRGKGGTRQVEVNAHGRIVREVSRREPVSGDDVVLSLDMEVQRFAQERLAGISASAVVLDVTNGEVISFVSSPGYDPNEFITGFSQARWQEMNDDPLRPLLNKALAGEYPPGSTFKMMTGLAALEAGAISEDTHVTCVGHMNLGSARFHCWRRGGHGSVNFRRALQVSCDVFFYEAARRVGVDRVTAMARRFGLGEKFNFEVPGERGGLMPTEAWKREKRNEPWNPGDTLNSAIGQGFVLATPLQLAVMTARLANGGKAVTPHIVRAMGGRAKALPEPADLGVPKQGLDIVHAGMDDATNAPGGTAYGSRIVEPELRMAGKTGTSQVRRISMAERAAGVRSESQLPYHLRNHALYVAYAPADAPRYAISVVVEHGGGGSKAAAPPARDILKKVLERDTLIRGGTVAALEG